MGAFHKKIAAGQQDRSPRLRTELVTMAAPPLQCQAVLHQAAHRGIDLQRWFGPAVIPSGDFEKKMMGLGLGVAAGLPAEAAQCVERGLARGALDEAVAAAAAGDDQVDVAKLLSLAKVSVGRPPARQKPWTAPRPRTAPVPSSRKAATALAATELQRQKVTPSRLRGLKVALRRSGETIDVDALQKALGTQNLRLRDANAAALVREAAWRSQQNEEGAPTKAPLIGIISLVEDLFAPSEKPPAPSYEAWKKHKDEAQKGRARIQFRRALGGLSHALDAPELKEMLLKYQVLNEDALTEEIRASAREWARSPDGHFAQLKAGLKNSDSDVEEGRRKVLRDLEQKTGFVTLETWKRYELALKRRDACEGPLPFETYLASMKTERAKAEKVVEEWTKSKDEEEKLRKEDRMRRAPVDKVVDEMRSLYDQAHDELDGQYKASRICPSIEAKLRGFTEKAQNGLVTKAQFDDTFGKEAFSLLADKRVAPKALALADASVRQSITARRSSGEKPTSEVFGMSSEEASKHAKELSEKKENETSEDYAKWVAAKAEERKKATKARKEKAKQLKQGLDSTRSDVEAKLTAWRKAQAKASKALKKRAAYTGDDAETITKLEDAVDAANKLRAETGVAATAATKRWKALKSARKVARGK